MTKYVVQVPDPPAGADWSTVVPGIYLWDVVGITATLTTQSGLTTYVDSSGHGRDALLDPGPYNLTRQAGPYGGGAKNYGVRVPKATGPTAQYSNATGGLFSISMWEWFDGGVGGSGTFYMFVDNQSGGNVLCPWGYYFGGVNPGHGWTNPQDLADIQSGTVFNVSTGFMPLNGWHHFASRTNPVHGDGHFDVFLDGALIASNLTNTGALGSFFPVLGGGPIPPGQRAGIGYFDQALSNGQVAAHYAARTSSAAYKAALLADSPTGLWMLDESTDTGRTPTLYVSNGTQDVFDIPAGFQAVTTPGPYVYSWQPGLNADTQSTDGTLTTVAIPALIIPPGYTVGTSTLDLQPTDQWSNITLWWDDSYQNLTVNLPPYAYPPGATLKRTAQGVL